MKDKHLQIELFDKLSFYLYKQVYSFHEHATSRPRRLPWYWIEMIENIKQ